ncbi:hypothetical protein Anapl_10133 [Anas platyrhynchos]|uniref:Uncharacterized protein n=1 Tax=Anas platyrhynchos TaxID=8839 RepID=R0JZW6_ANAPL|nr:hypothetical protein Anapl_10133 [Anas platyrhynchos]
MNDGCSAPVSVPVPGSCVALLHNDSEVYIGQLLFHPCARWYQLWKGFPEHSKIAESPQHLEEKLLIDLLDAVQGQSATRVKNYSSKINCGCKGTATEQQQVGASALAFAAIGTVIKDEIANSKGTYIAPEVPIANIFVVIKVPLLKRDFLDVGPMFTELLQRVLAVDNLCPVLSKYRKRWEQCEVSVAVAASRASVLSGDRVRCRYLRQCALPRPLKSERMTEADGSADVSAEMMSGETKWHVSACDLSMLKGFLANVGIWQPPESTCVFCQVCKTLEDLSSTVLGLEPPSFVPDTSQRTALFRELYLARGLGEGEHAAGLWGVLCHAAVGNDEVSALQAVAPQESGCFWSPAIRRGCLRGFGE